MSIRNAYQAAQQEAEAAATPKPERVTIIGTDLYRSMGESLAASNESMSFELFEPETLVPSLETSQQMAEEEQRQAAAAAHAAREEAEDQSKVTGAAVFLLDVSGYAAGGENATNMLKAITHKSLDSHGDVTAALLVNRPQESERTEEYNNIEATLSQYLESSQVKILHDPSEVSGLIQSA